MFFQKITDGGGRAIYLLSLWSRVSLAVNSAGALLPTPGLRSSPEAGLHFSIDRVKASLRGAKTVGAASGSRERRS